MGSTRLDLLDSVAKREIIFEPRRVILAGYTGRDPDDVLRHIDELSAEGIPAPEKVPELYRCAPDSLQIGGKLSFGEGWSSGEIEYVLFDTDQGFYVGVGSDHTDRVLEQTSALAAKQAFPKIVGSQVWALDRLVDDWDSLMLRSWLTANGVRRAYQQGSLASLIKPDELLSLARDEEPGDGLVVFSGTVHTIEPAPRTGLCRFDGELLDPQEQVLSACHYEYEAAPRDG